MTPLHSNYIQLTGNIEDLRLHLQNQAVRYFDEDVYHRVFGNYASPLILDVGCGTGDMIVDMTDHNPACRIYGIDLVKRQIELAAERYPQCKFLTADIEQDSFQDDMRSWMESEDIQGFDIINCSMILMHLSDPVNALKKLRELLKDEGTLIVREVDDGLQYAWPDPKGRIEKFSRYLSADDRLGDRHCGRKVYTYLKNAGFHLIHLEKEGLSSISIPDRMSLYEMVFPYIMDHMRNRALNAPEHSRYHEAYEWIAENIDEIKKYFSRDDFIFNIGFMSFSAMR